MILYWNPFCFMLCIYLMEMISSSCLKWRWGWNVKFFVHVQRMRVMNVKKISILLCDNARFEFRSWETLQPNLCNLCSWRNICIHSWKWCEGIHSNAHCKLVKFTSLEKHVTSRLGILENLWVSFCKNKYLYIFTSQ